MTEHDLFFNLRIKFNYLKGDLLLNGPDESGTRGAQMLKNVLIFWSHGRLLYARAFGKQEKDPQLISGLLSAFSDFVKELGEREIRSIQMHPHKIFMSMWQELCFSIFLDLEDDEAQGNLILKDLIDSFLAIYGTRLDPNMVIDMSTFKEFDVLVEDFNILKNIFEVLESTPQKLTLPAIQEAYLEKFNMTISPEKCWYALNRLVMHDAIVEVREEHVVLYRKKGELLKRFKGFVSSRK